jgi:hypothetical protein
MFFIASLPRSLKDVQTEKPYRCGDMIFHWRRKLFLWSLETFMNTVISLSVIWSCGVGPVINPGLWERFWCMIPGYPKD